MTYVAQEAWVQNATLRDNVLFGKPMNTAVYDKIIDACALQPDIEDFPGYDLTEIGEKACIILLFYFIVHVSQKKLCQCYFLNNSVKHWPTLIIFGMRHREET